MLEMCIKYFRKFNKYRLTRYQKSQRTSRGYKGISPEQILEWEEEERNEYYGKLLDDLHKNTNNQSTRNTK